MRSGHEAVWPEPRPKKEAAASVMAAAIRQGDLAACDAIDLAIDRWQASHQRLNALVQPRLNAARAEAAAVRAGDSRPLAGVPVSLKDCFPLAGLSTTLGIRSRSERADEQDCDLVRRLRQAGAIVLGKANVPQALYLHETVNPVFGRTMHPERTDRGPGGSSGGDAALVAAGVVPLAFGNDLAGSVRQPAHSCGVVGYLPSSRSLGNGGAFNTMPWLTALRSRAGIFARAVADVTLAVAATTGNVDTRGDAAETAVRVGWWDAVGPVVASAAVRRGVQEAVAALAAAGVSTHRVDAGFAETAGWLHLGILTSDGGRSIRHLLDDTDVIPPVAELLRIGGLPRALRPLAAGLTAVVGRSTESDALRRTGPRSAADRAVLLRARDALANCLNAWRRDVGIDAVVCPVSAVPALPHGLAARLVLAAFPCLFANLLDLPAGTVPVTRVRPAETVRRGAGLDPVAAAAVEVDAGSEGLPVGVQVVALDGRDETALQVMAAIELGSQWDGRSR